MRPCIHQVGHVIMTVHGGVMNQDKRRPNKGHARLLVSGALNLPTGRLAGRRLAGLRGMRACIHACMHPCCAITDAIVAAAAVARVIACHYMCYCMRLTGQALTNDTRCSGPL